MGTMGSLWGNSPFRMSLEERQPQTYQEFLDRARGYINREEAENNQLKSKVIAPNNNDANQSHRKHQNKK